MYEGGGTVACLTTYSQLMVHSDTAARGVVIPHLTRSVLISKMMVTLHIMSDHFPLTSKYMSDPFFFCHTLMLTVTIFKVSNLDILGLLS